MGFVTFVMHLTLLGSVQRVCCFVTFPTVIIVYHNVILNASFSRGCVTKSVTQKTLKSSICNAERNIRKRAVGAGFETKRVCNVIMLC